MALKPGDAQHPRPSVRSESVAYNCGMSPARPREVSKRVSLLVLLAVAVPSVGLGADDLHDVVVGVYVDEGAHPTCVAHATTMFERMGFSTRSLPAEDVNRESFEGLAVIYFPGGDSPPYIDGISPMGRARLLAAIDDGMAYIGTCAGAVFAAEAQICEGKTYRDGQLGVFLGDAVGPAAGVCPGEWCSASLSVHHEHASLSGAAAEIQVLFRNGPFFRPAPAAETHILATYTTTGEPAIVAQRRSAGWVLLSGPHPEYEVEGVWSFFKDCVLWSLGLLPEEES